MTVHATGAIVARRSSLGEHGSPERVEFRRAQIAASRSSPTSDGALQQGWHRIVGHHALYANDKGQQHCGRLAALAAALGMLHDCRRHIEAHALHGLVHKRGQRCTALHEPEKPPAILH
eukprot:5884691-Prymnesium_polylepis.1